MSEKKNAAADARDELSEKRNGYDLDKPVDRGGVRLPFVGEVKSSDEKNKGKLEITSELGTAELKISGGSVVLDRDGVNQLSRTILDLEGAL